MSRIAENLGPGLFDAETIVRAMPDGVPIDVCILFEKLALELKAKGFAYYSARDITAHMRWHHQVDRNDREFVINNNWSPALARWFIARHPDMADFFELRESPHAVSKS